MRPFPRVVAIACLVCACSSGGERAPAPTTGPAPAAVNAQLGGDVVARVGNVNIDRALVLAVARARSISAKAAVDALVEEAVIAEAALRAGAAGDRGARVEVPLARAMLDRFRTEALAAGPWTDEEIGKLAAEQWRELDRPEGRAVVHALVKKEVPDAEQVAKQLREKLVDANGPDAAASAKAFTDAAHAFKVPSGPAVHVEELSFVSDGRMLEGNGSLLPAFTKGAFAIPSVLGTSDVVETSYGFHVIRLLTIFPPKIASREERIARLEPQLVGARVKALHDAKLAALHKANPPQLLAADADLLLPR